MPVNKSLAVTGWKWVRNKLQSKYFYWANNLRFFTNHIFSTQHHQVCCTEKYLIILEKIKLSVLSMQGPLDSNKIMYQILKEALSENHRTFCWILTSTLKHHIISIQYLAEMFSWEIMSWLFKDLNHVLTV